MPEPLEATKDQNHRVTREERNKQAVNRYNKGVLRWNVEDKAKIY